MSVSPQSTLNVVISLDRQQLTLYSDGTPVATSRVSSGRPGHSTPTGVFSIIQKDRWHHSTLYDDAPMFFMQRLTWSGVALHQGIVPNTPASHGCVRLPEAFARQLWGITRLGARVVIAHGDVAPVAISHPLLLTHKAEPLVAAREPTPVAAHEPTPAERVDAAFRAADRFNRAGVDPMLMASAMLAQNATNLSGGTTAYDGWMGMPGPDLWTPPAASAQTPGPTAAPLKASPISVFISRREGKLFVRKGFEPVFDVPVTFAQPEVPLGTHVFTALAAKGDNLRWIVTSLPTSEARAKPGEAAPTAARALDRISIPPDAMEWISSLVTPGASLIVSDQGLGPETGTGTDFIVLTR